MGSLFTGIGGFDLAFEREGFETAWQCEVDPHATRVLETHWPAVTRYGDVTTLTNPAPVDVVTFGSPCQDLSVAGKRAGLDGERSGLFFEAMRVIREMREATDGRCPTFALWENVPGALSSNHGLDFATVLDAVAELGAVDICWRVLDAQYFGVPQRRRRIFLVADFGGERGREVLFELEGVCGDPAAGGTPGQDVATRPGRGVTDASGDGCITGDRSDPGAQPGNWTGDGSYANDRAFTVAVISRRGRKDGCSDEIEWDRSPALRAGDGGSSRGLLVAPFDARQIASGYNRSTVEFGDVSPTLHSDGMSIVAKPLGAHHRRDDLDNDTYVIQDVRAEKRQNGIGIAEGAPMYTLDGTSQHGVYVPEIVPQAMSSKWAKGSSGPAGDDVANMVAPRSRVRRLTPTECERLQGFPDGWTAGQSDSHRYRQLGNAVAVPVAQWIARRAAVLL
jgi:DNA (cytosine-5)-methyltransferase 1